MVNKKKNKSNKPHKDETNISESSDSFNWTLERVGMVLKTLYLIMIVSMFVYLSTYQLMEGEYAIFFWMFVAISGVLNLIQFKNQKRDVYFIYVGYVSLVFAILGVLDLFNIGLVNVLPNIQYGNYIIYLIVGIVLGKLLTEYTMHQKEWVSTEADGSNNKFILALISNRYQLSSLLATLGIALLVGGYMAEMEWYYTYLISLLMVIPLFVALFKDLSIINKTPEGVQKPSLASRTNFFQFLTEMIVSLVLFVVLVFVIWGTLGVDNQNFIGYANWIKMSIILTVGFEVILHIIFEKSTLRSMFANIREGNFSMMGKKTEVGTNLDGMSEWTLREQLILTELLLTSMFIVCSIYLVQGVLNVVNEVGVFSTTIIQLIIAFAFAIMSLTASQFYYAEYLHRTTKIDLLQARKLIYLFGFVHLIILAIALSYYALYDSSIDMFMITSLSSLIIFSVVMIQIMSVPSFPKESYDSMPSSMTLLYVFAIILGCLAIGFGIFGVIQIETIAYTYLLLSVLGIIFGVIIAIIGSLGIIKKYQNATTKKDEISTAGSFGGLIVCGFVIYLAIQTLLTNYNIFALDFTDGVVTVWVWGLVIAIGGFIFFLGKIIGNNKTLTNAMNRSAKRRRDEALSNDTWIIILTVVNWLCFIYFLVVGLMTTFDSYSYGSILFGMVALASTIAIIRKKMVKGKTDGLSNDQDGYYQKIGSIGLFLQIAMITILILTIVNFFIRYDVANLDLNNEAILTNICLMLVAIGVFFTILIGGIAKKDAIEEESDAESTSIPKSVKIIAIVFIGALISLGLYMLIAYPFEIASINTILGLASCVLAVVLGGFSIFYFREENEALGEKSTEIKTDGTFGSSELNFITENKNVIKSESFSKPEEIKRVTRGFKEKKSKNSITYTFDV
jgi:hypothetical protein